MISSRKLQKISHIQKSYLKLVILALIFNVCQTAVASPTSVGADEISPSKSETENAPFLITETASDTLPRPYSNPNDLLVSDMMTSGNQINGIDDLLDHEPLLKYIAADTINSHHPTTHFGDDDDDDEDDILINRRSMSHFLRDRKGQSNMHFLRDRKAASNMHFLRDRKGASNMHFLRDRRGPSNMLHFLRDRRAPGKLSHFLRDRKASINHFLRDRRALDLTGKDMDILRQIFDSKTKRELNHLLRDRRAKDVRLKIKNMARF